MRPKKNVVPERPWWSTEWLDAARKGGLKTRLQRGKILAKEGRVQDVQIEPGLLQGEIRMSPQIKYHPTIQWEIPTEAKRDKILQALETKPHVMAQLLNGQLDVGWKEIFSDVGSELFPEDLTELKMDCSCGDPQHLCTHLAALFQITADEFERNPAAWLIYRGISQESWQKSNYTIQSSSSDDEEVFLAKEFWSGEHLPPLPSNQNDPLHIMQNLGPFPLWQGYGKGPTDGLKNFYLAAADLEAEPEDKDRN